MPPAHYPMDAHVPALRSGGSGRGEVKNAGDLTVKAMSLAVADTQTLDASLFKTAWTESFDSSFGRLSRVWGDVKIDTTLGAAVLTSTAQGGWAPAGMMVPPTSASAGNGYGLYTIVAETSDRAGPGPFAALWPSTDKWPGPERDIFEKASQADTDGYSTVHWADASGNDRYQVYRYPAGLYAMNDPHTYQMEWAADHLSLFIDSHLVYSTNANLTADFAHGGQNAAFGAGMQPAWAAAQQTGGSNVLTVYEMSYAAPVAPVASPPPGMSVGDASIAEGGTLTFTVKLDAPSLGPVTVNFSTVDGTAKAGSDYIAAAGTLTFAPNETSRTVTVDTTPDKEVEPDETLTLHLDGAVGANLGKADGTGTILNDDVAPTPSLKVGNASVAEGGLLNFTVSLSAASAAPVTVKYNTVNGTATAPGDYGAKALTTLTFAAGETSKTVQVQTVQDPAVEANETMKLHLSAPTGATLAVADGTGTIVNNDVAGRTYTGTNQANTLTGTQYNDNITGARGNDTITGGAGEDRFLFSRYDGFDRIKDFTPGTDELVFKGLAASAITAKAATYSGISGTDVSYGGTDHVFLEKVALASFSIASDVVFA